jgi:peptidoglycan LD-endopeptidase LytH
MTRKHRGAGLGIVALAFVAGMLVDGWLRVYGPPLPAQVRAKASAPAPTAASAPQTDASPRMESTSRPIAPVATTGRSKLRLPIDGANVDAMRGGFAEARTGHPHEAVDILAPRHTPIHAVDEGTIAKLFVSKAGGNTIYQFDRSGRLAYYYAHLERYADGLREGASVKQGDVIGYVGTSGNAPANTPHLHFAVFELGPERQWWKGKAIDPYLVFR